MSEAMWIWNPWVLPATAAVLLHGFLAYFVLRSRADRFQNRVLAAMVLAESLFFLLHLVVAGSTTDAAVAGHAMVASGAVILVLQPLYILFISTLDTPLARPVAHRWVRGILVATIPLLAAAPWLFPGRFLTGVEAAETPLGWVPQAGQGMGPVELVAIVVFTYALVAAVSLIRRSRPGTPARTRARFVLAAFLVRDGFSVIRAVAFAWAFYTTGPVLSANLILLFVVLGLPTASLAFTALLSYGILKHQVFDIDLKIKVGISRTTPAAVIAGAAFVGSELIEAAFGVDQTLPALLIAAAVALAFRPLTALGNQLADRLFPRVDDSPSYVAERKRHVYAAALAEAEQDGLTDEERAGLEALRRRLGLETQEEPAASKPRDRP